MNDKEDDYNRHVYYSNIDPIHPPGGDMQWITLPNIFHITHSQGIRVIVDILHLMRHVGTKLIHYTWTRMLHADFFPCRSFCMLYVSTCIMPALILYVCKHKDTHCPLYMAGKVRVFIRQSPKHATCSCNYSVYILENLDEMRHGTSA